MTLRVPPAIAVVLAGLIAPAAGEEPGKARPAAPRETIEALEAQLDHAVDRVSLPHAARLLGRAETARGYRLPGYGIVLVLTPRALPGGEGQVYVFHTGAPRHRRVRVESRPPGEPPPGEPPPGVPEDEASIEALERQVLVLQHETEAARRAAEDEMERIVETVRVRVARSDEGRAPAPPFPEAPPAPPAAPGAPVLPEAVAPPPWARWFGSRAPDEGRTAEAVVADVRAAVVDALAATGPRLASLPGDERVTVAVDFVPGGIFAARARPERTLVVTARVRDVQALARGAITADELRRRVEVSEH
jgi:hypothetical protein